MGNDSALGLRTSASSSVRASSGPPTGRKEESGAWLPFSSRVDQWLCPRPSRLRAYQGHVAGAGKYSSLKYWPVGPSGPSSAYLAMRCPASSTVLVPWWPVKSVWV